MKNLGVRELPETTGWQMGGMMPENWWVAFEASRAIPTQIWNFD